MTYKIAKYLPGDSMSDLICDNYPMLLVMSRFGIELGFGEATIEQVCAQNEVDLNTFLAVVNLLTGNYKRGDMVDYRQISLSSLISYLHSSHTYFLDYRLPIIRRELEEALDHASDVSTVILSYYDQYVAEVNKHMMYEERVLFPYINAIASGVDAPQEYSIEVYSAHHDNVGAKLSELKSIMIKYYPSKSTNLLNNVLYDIFSCERDLASHNRIEDNLLVPTIKEIESNKKL